jgi:hypothetical protein
VLQLHARGARKRRAAALISISALSISSTGRAEPAPPAPTNVIPASERFDPETPAVVRDAPAAQRCPGWGSYLLGGGAIVAGAGVTTGSVWLITYLKKKGSNDEGAWLPGFFVGAGAGGVIGGVIVIVDAATCRPPPTPLGARAPQRPRFAGAAVTPAEGGAVGTVQFRF